MRGLFVGLVRRRKRGSELLHSSFKLSSSGEELAVYDAGTWVDGVVFPTQSADISYGRSTDAATEWAWFEAPTLGTSNNAATAFEGITHGIPYFSVKAGFMARR